MTFEDRNKPTSFRDLVFHDQQTSNLIAPLFDPANARNLLLHGPGGSGKSATCRVMAETLLGQDWLADITRINVSRVTSKAALCDRITDTVGCGSFNRLGRNVFVLEELDGADFNAQLALKVVIDDLEPFSLFLATTNNVGGITQPLRDRFLEVQFFRPDAQAWANRAVEILKAEQVTVSVAQAKHLIHLDAPAGSMRDVMRVLDRFAGDVRRANPNGGQS